jgi:hypothetical protein
MPAGSTYTPIATTTLGSAQTSYTFSSISGSYTDLILVYQFELSSAENIAIRFNGDTGSNYSFTALYGDGSTPGTNRGTSTTGINAGFDDGSGNITRINIQNYSNTTTNKTCVMRTDSSTYTVARVGLWRNTSAINSITIYNTGGGNINSGSIFTLYGISAA